VPLALVTIFHMIEWLRWTAFLTTALVSANLMPLYYALSVNVPFGVIVCSIAIATRFGTAGEDCALVGNQETRSFYLGLQIVCLFLILPFSFAHVIYLKIRGVEWCHEKFLHEEEDEED